MKYVKCTEVTLVKLFDNGDAFVKDKHGVYWQIPKYIWERDYRPVTEDSLE